MAYKGIGEYGLIGNSHTAALVGTDGSIDWCCLPRFDSPSVFAAILDDDIGGRFRVAPPGPFRADQAYVPNTNILRTTFRTDTGAASLVDFMPCYLTPRGRLVQVPEVHRLVECSEGRVTLEAVFEPRLDYARGETSLSVSKYGITARKDAETLTLSTTAALEIAGNAASAMLGLERGQRAAFVLSHGRARPRHPGMYGSARKLERTAAYWQDKADGCVFTGPWRDAIVRSYLALHLLVYSPTGAIIAAPTTSLPEEIGGERNWDYRYTWLRDASLTLRALFQLGHGDEATGFMNWLLDVCDRCGPKAQILYDIDFQDPLEERELDHLRGYRDSRPVRIGNAAYQQRQLDVFGEVLEAAWSYMSIGGHITRRAWKLLESFVDAACILWKWPDQGIWEIRGGPYHFVYSKAMCWVAVQRGVRIAERLGHRRNLRRWWKTAREIKADILARGWNLEKGAFTQHYDTNALDSSNLLMAFFDFLPLSDARMRSTIKRTVEELGWNGLLRRYRTDEVDDGLSGSEGAFLWCSFWLVRILLRMDRRDEALALYERLLGYGNHVGLLPEMVDPTTGEALGNFPQALSHLGVIVTGLELTQALDAKKA